MFSYQIIFIYCAAYNLQNKTLFLLSSVFVIVYVNKYLYTFLALNTYLRSHLFLNMFITHYIGSKIKYCLKLKENIQSTFFCFSDLLLPHSISSKLIAT